MDSSHIPTPAPGGYKYNAVYQYVDHPRPKCSSYDLEEDETIAVSQTYLQNGTYRCGDQYYIEGHGEKVYTITDTGTFRNQYQFDIYAGEQTHVSLYEKYSDTGTYHKVAKVQR